MKKTFHWWFCFQLFLIVMATDDRARRIRPGKLVRISTGQIRGSLEIYGLSKQMYTFKGIPYAQPPIGNLRFRAPVPIQPWNNVKLTTKYGSNCPQYAIFTNKLVGDENCLFLNVFTPVRIQNPLPVLVSIHGGAFKIGSGDADRLGPELFIQQNIIYVSMNYRLGVLGFLNSGDRFAPGNFGLKDVLLVLRWVKQNIAAFGGNPNDVTIQGISAGSMIVHALVLSRSANGLFNKAISQSGSMFTTDAFNYNPKASFDKLLRRLYLYNGNTENVVNQLRRISMERLISAANVFDKEPPAMYESGDFVPSMDPPDSPEIRILPNTPQNLMRNGNINRVPYILGFMSVEQMGDIKKIRENPTIIERYIQSPYLLIPQIWNLQPGTAQAREVISAILEMYFNGRLNSTENFALQWANYASDRHFVYGISKTCRAQSTLQNIFYYRFSYSGAFNYMKKMSGLTDIPGATHTEDAYYMYRHNVFLGNVTSNDFAYTVRSRQVRLWTNFVKSGKPTPNADNSLGVTWVRSTANNQEYLDIDRNLVIRNQPYPQRLNMWIEFDRRFNR